MRHTPDDLAVKDFSADDSYFYLDSCSCVTALNYVVEVVVVYPMEVDQVAMVVVVASDCISLHYKQEEFKFYHK